jgi:hypothetical protein
MAAGGVLDILDVAADVGLNGGILEDAVAGSVEGAVFQYEVLNIAQLLLSS